MTSQAPPDFVSDGELDSLPPFDQIRPVATMVVRSPEEWPFVSKQSALEELAEVYRKYLNTLPPDLKEQLLDKNQDIDVLAKRLEELDQANTEQPVVPDMAWLAASLIGQQSSKEAREQRFSAVDEWNLIQS